MKKTTEVALIPSRSVVQPKATKAEIMQAMALVMSQENEKFNKEVRERRKALNDAILVAAAKAPKSAQRNLDACTEREGVSVFTVEIDTPEIQRLKAQRKALPACKMSHYEGCLAQVKERMNHERMTAVTDNPDARKAIEDALSGIGLLEKTIEAALIS